MIVGGSDIAGLNCTCDIGMFVQVGQAIKETLGNKFRHIHRSDPCEQ